MEILVVLAVIGALAVGVSLSVHAASAGASLQRAGEDIEVFMASAKAQAAVSSSPMVVVFHPGQSVVRLRRIVGEGSELTHHLPGGVVIDGVRGGGATQRGRPLRLMIQPSGYVRDFAIRLARDRRRLWVQWNPAVEHGWSFKRPSEVAW